MDKGKVFIYPSLGDSYSMNRYFDGVVSGLKENRIPYEVVRPMGSGLKAKYVDYPLISWRKRKSKGKHLVISERYAYLVPFMNSDSIVVCHDLHTLYKEAKTPKVHQLLYRFFLRLMWRAKKVVCVSNHTKSDLLKFVPKFSAHQNLEVVHNGIEQFWTDKARVETGDRTLMDLFKSKKILLSVGTDAWYKNNQWSLKLLADLPQEFHLLRIGSFNGSNEALLKYLDIEPRITRVENLCDLDLKFCYQNATAFLFPSITEGFGWPVLEATLCGCPVISNGNGATAEIGISTLIKLSEAKAMLLSSTYQTQRLLTFNLWSKQINELLD